MQRPAVRDYLSAISLPPSRLHLHRLEDPPATILAYLIGRFPHMAAATWHDRVARGVVTTSDGDVLREDSPYRHGVTIFYRREVPSEPDLLESEVVVYRDDHILVADKPHGMPVTPAGEYLERSLLVRLQRSTGLTTIAPMHRLDRETAGIVLFTINAAVRGPYHQLFAERKVQREYLAAAHLVDVPNRKHWRVENRIEAGTPWYRQRIVEKGLANAITEIELLEVRGETGLFRLRPATGKKHQLRVHMTSIGFPIVGDPLYPRISEKLDEDPPLQLLANRLAFIDPLSAAPRNFSSSRHLA